MSSSYPIFTLRTAEIVGRTELLRQLKAARLDVAAIDSPARLFYLVGEGGMGKTRVLEELEVRRNEVPDQLVTGVIDFYDSRHHSRTNLEESIVDSLPQDEDVKGIFAQYREALAGFRNLSASGGVAERQRSDLEAAFFAAWQALVAKFSVVIRLDTAELLQFQDDEIRERFDLDLPVATSRRWLDDVVKGGSAKLGRTLIVVAGRPSEQLSAGLGKLAQLDGRDYVANLGGLTPEESDTYFAKLAGTLAERGYQPEAEELRGLSPALRARFVQLTGGRPIALAVALQLYVSDLGAPFKQLLASERAHYDRTTQLALRQALVNGVVYDVFGNLSQPLRLLPLARRGLTPELLQDLWGKQYSLEECAATIKELKGQIFTKVRPDGSIVLHDEVADWAEAELYPGTPDAALAIYGKLAEAYRVRFKGVRNIIHDVAKHTNQLLEMSNLDNDAAAPPARRIAAGEYRELLALVEQRRQLALDLLYYLLRSDPVEGYRHYYELAEEAFNVNLTDYDAQIHSEFLQWWGADDYDAPTVKKFRALAAKKGITEDVVKIDLAVRWVQRQYNMEGIDAKQATADLVQRVVDELRPNAVARYKLETYAVTARSQIGLEDAAIAEIQAAFSRNLTQLRRTARRYQSDDSIKSFLADDALAFTEYEAGYFYRGVLGDYDQAIDHFTESVRLYKQLHFEINQARSLNERAYALARAGEVQSALFAVTDALNLRIELGLARVAALSMNTKGIVYTYALKPVTAEGYCRQALAIFTSLDDRWGQMLALLALSEAYRRKADGEGIRLADQFKALQDALNVSTNARKHAEELGVSPALAAQIIDEQGCAYRDLVRFCLAHAALCDDDCDPTCLAQKATDCFADALKDIQRYNYLRHMVLDITTNKAYLAYYTGAPETALIHIREALDLVPPDFQLPNDKAYGRRHAYRVQLAKIYALKAQLSGLALNHAFAGTQVQSDDPQSLLLNFARDASQTLYFAVQLPDYRPAREARRVIYDQLRTLSVALLHELSSIARQVEVELHVPRQVAADAGLRYFIRTQFGVK